MYAPCSLTTLALVVMRLSARSCSRPSRRVLVARLKRSLARPGEDPESAVRYRTKLTTNADRPDTSRLGALVPQSTKTKVSQRRAALPQRRLLPHGPRPTLAARWCTSWW
jgi:hypothetical protein